MRVGADEAGKGPVLGPMVAGAVRADPETLPDGLADSKQLSTGRRAELDAELRDHPDVRAAVAVVTPGEIDAPDTDMNSLGVAAQVEAVAGVVEPGDAVFADAADTDAARFGKRLTDGLTEWDETLAGLAVTAEHGADDTYSVVSAASIVAKVERDRLLERINEEYDRDVGSGYPSDPTTRAFLEDYVAEHGELPACARASWSTSADVLASAEQSGLGEF